MFGKIIEKVGGLLTWADPASLDNRAKNLNDETVNHVVSNKDRLFTAEELVEHGLRHCFEYQNVNNPVEDPVGLYQVYELRKIRYVFRVVQGKLKLYVLTKLD